MESKVCSCGNGAVEAFEAQNHHLLGCSDISSTGPILRSPFGIGAKM